MLQWLNLWHIMDEIRMWSTVYEMHLNPYKKKYKKLPKV